MATDAQIDALIAGIRSRADNGDDEAKLAWGGPGGFITDPVINDQVVSGIYGPKGEGIKDTGGGSNAMKSLLQGVADWVAEGVNPLQIAATDETSQLIQLQSRVASLSGTATSTNIIAQSALDNKQTLLLDSIHDGSGAPSGTLGFVFRTGSTSTLNRLLRLTEDGVCLVNGPNTVDATLDANQATADVPARLQVQGSLLLSAAFGDADNQLPAASVRGTRIFIGGLTSAYQLSIDDGDGNANETWNAVRIGSNYVAVTGGVQPNLYRTNNGDFTWYNVTGAAPTNPGDTITWTSVLHVDQGNNNVGVNTTTPSGTYALDVAGQAHATAFPISSDERLKKNVVRLSNCLDKLEHINGVAFDWNDTYTDMGRSTHKREIGVIAQAVEKQFPELVQDWEDYDENDNLRGRWKAVDYSRMVAVLLEAVKELSSRLKALERRS